MGLLSGFAQGIGDYFEQHPTAPKEQSVLPAVPDMTPTSEIPSVPIDMEKAKGAMNAVTSATSEALQKQFPLAYRVAQSLGYVESGGNYGALGPTVHGQHAIGKYQVMPNNLPEWGKETVGRPLTPEEFKKDPDLQDRLVVYKIQRMLNEGHSPQDAASIWFSGRPLKNNQRADLATGITVPEYVKKFNKHFMGA